MDRYRVAGRSGVATQELPAAEVTARPGPPAAHGRTQSSGGAGRILFTILFWFALAASVEVWWLDTRPRSIATTGEIFLAGGRLTGMAAGFVLLAQVLLMSRVRWLETWMG